MEKKLTRKQKRELTKLKVANIGKEIMNFVWKQFDIYMKAGYKPYDAFKCGLQEGDRHISAMIKKDPRNKDIYLRAGKQVAKSINQSIQESIKKQEGKKDE